MIAAACAQTPAPFPQPQQSPDTVIRINVNLVQVDAVVTDSKDRPVTDLQAEDFEVLQDGKPQPITNFSFITLGRAGAPAPRPAAAGKGAPPVPPAKIKPGEVRRTVALVVDDLGLSFESVYRVRQALKKFVDEEIQPGDLVAIIRTGAGIGALQQFTTDKRILYAAIERVRYNALGRVGVSSFEPLGANTGEDQGLRDFRSQAFSVGTLGAVRYIVNGLHELGGRKAVVLFSENLRLFTGDNDQRVLEEVRHLTDAANRASVVLYTIDPRGLQTHGLTAADDTRGMRQDQIAQVPTQRSEEEFHSRDGLVVLAHDTGGRFFGDNNDLNSAVRAVMRDTEGYYLIGYHPAAETFDAKTGQPRFHKVAVRLKRPGLHVRSRSGFFGTSDRLTTPPLRGREAQIAHALTSPFAAGSIHVRLTPLFSQGPKGSFLNTLLYIDGKDLKFTDEPDGWHKAVFDLVAITFGDNGQAVDSSDRTYTLRVRQEAYEQTVKGGVLYAVSHPVRKPGPYQMRVVIRDTSTEEVGTASQFIEVPDVSKGRLTLSSIVIRELGNLQQRQPDQAEGQVAAQNIQGTPAVRVFRQGQTLVYGYEILNAAKSPHLEAQSRLFRDGKQVFEGKNMPLTAQILPDGKRMVGGGNLKLGAAIAPGDYVLQLTVTDTLAKEKYRSATQWIDFEIQ